MAEEELKFNRTIDKLGRAAWSSPLLLPYLSPKRSDGTRWVEQLLLDFEAGKMEPKIKARVLVAFFGLPREQLLELRDMARVSSTGEARTGNAPSSLRALLDRADLDTDDWVRVVSGLLRVSVFGTRTTRTASVSDMVSKLTTHLSEDDPLFPDHAKSPYFRPRELAYLSRRALGLLYGNPDPKKDGEGGSATSSTSSSVEGLLPGPSIHFTARAACDLKRKVRSMKSICESSAKVVDSSAPALSLPDDGDDPQGRLKRPLPKSGTEYRENKSSRRTIKRMGSSDNGNSNSTSGDTMRQSSSARHSENSPPPSPSYAADPIAFAAQSSAVEVTLSEITPQLRQVVGERTNKITEADIQVLTAFLERRVVTTSQENKTRQKIKLNEEYRETDGERVKETLYVEIDFTTFKWEMLKKMKRPKKATTA